MQDEQSEPVSYTHLDVYKRQLLDGSAFAKADQHQYDPQTKIHASQSVKYDLIGKLVAETKLTLSLIHI